VGYPCSVIVPENPGGAVREMRPNPHDVGGNVSRSRWWVHLILTAAYPLVIGMLSFGGGVRRPPALAHDAAGLLRTCAFQLAIFGLIFALAWTMSRASAEKLYLNWRGGFLPIPLGILYSIGLRVGLALIAIFVMLVFAASHVIKIDDLQHLTQNNRPDVEALVDINALKNDPRYYWLSITFVSFVVAGLREELWRAGVIAGLCQLWPSWFASRPGSIAAVGIAAAVFGFGHLAQGPVAMAAAGLLGFGLGTIMVLHRSIWPAVIAHGLFDATTFAALPWLFERIPHLR
jgi:membrane protease YdiL (CAAX protease family)